MTWYDKTVKIWLDDVRPAPDGWIHLKNIDQVKAIFDLYIVEEMSLDHDLGPGLPCWDCEEYDNGNYEDCKVNCACHEPIPTGYDLVKWMAENEKWPQIKPKVHSANPVGRANMIAVIDRYFKD